MEPVEADADYDIFISGCKECPVVVNEDTDIMVLIVHHLDISLHPIFMKKSSYLVDIGIFVDELGPSLTKAILFAHAISGCDTTSKPCDIGDTSALKKFQNPEI